MERKNLTGYPSIDKPWLKYYDEKMIDTPLPRRSIYDNIYINNQAHLEDIALRYFDNRISYGKLFEGIGKAEKIFCSLGVKTQEVVSFISIFTPEMIYAFYALNKIGAVSSMLDPRATEDELAPNVVEEKILTCSLVENCACVGIEDKEHAAGQLPVAVIVPSDKNTDQNVIKNEVQTICKNELPEYEQPTEYYLYDKLPLTHAGKVDYRVLEKEVMERGE